MAEASAPQADRKVPITSPPRPGSLDQPRQHGLDPALADRKPEHVPPDLHQPLVADVRPLVEGAQERLDARTERPPWLQPGRIGAGGLLATLRAGHGVPPRFDHHRLERRQLNDLAPPLGAGGRSPEPYDGSGAELRASRSAISAGMSVVTVFQTSSRSTALY